MKPIIAYYRVSTEGQNESHLGLEGQDVEVKRYSETHECRLIGEFTEVETGADCARPMLAKALAEARRRKATLVVAKLDRLARNVHFISGLIESRVPFDVVNLPGADPMRLQMEAVFAEDELRRISARTRAALAAAKRRGVKLGSAREGHWEGREDRRQAGQRKASAKAASNRSKAAAEAYADRLNGEGQTTQRGLPWTPTAVSRVLGRAAA